MYILIPPATGTLYPPPPSFILPLHLQGWGGWVCIKFGPDEWSSHHSDKKPGVRQRWNVQVFGVCQESRGSSEMGCPSFGWFSLPCFTLTRDLKGKKIRVRDG